MSNLKPVLGSSLSTYISGPAQLTAPAARPTSSPLTPKAYRSDTLDLSQVKTFSPATLVQLFSPPASQPAAPQYITHTVRPGDTLSELAQRYLGDAKAYPELFKLNRDQMRNPNDLNVGMSLRVPAPQQPTLDSSIRPEPRPQNLNQLPRVTVKRGDSLSSIALEQLGNANRYLEIYNLNRDQLSNPNALRINMQLRLPLPQTSAPQPSPAPAPVIPIPSSPPARSFEHLVQSGETLSGLAQRYLGDSQRYLEIYNLNRDQLSSPTRIRAGMALKIPGAQPVQVPTGPQTSGAEALYQAMQRYQSYHAQRGHTNRTRTTPTQMREIATELDAAGRALGVDPKLMLAVFAHESGGINPNARSHTGAGGLGQLTGIAIRQVHYLAGLGGQRGKAPYTQYSQNFIRSTNSIQQRYNIKRNVWTSVAYMSYELHDRANLGRGVKNALKRYGDPHVANYADYVNDEYRTLFGGNLF